MEPEEVMDEQGAAVVADRTALVAKLYRRQYAPMVRLAHLITGSNEAAEDSGLGLLRPHLLELGAPMTRCLKIERSGG